MSMIVRPPSVSPAHQRRLKRTITRLLDRANEHAERLSFRTLRTIITENGDITPAVLPQLAGDVIGAIAANTIAKLRGTPVSGIAPTEGQALVYNGAEWIPGALGGEVIDYSTLVNEATTPQGATFSASSTSGNASEAEAYAADNDDATYWLSEAAEDPADPADGAWWKADLGSAKEITYYRVVQPTPTRFRASSSKLQSSTDNSAWTDRVTFGIFGDSGLIELASPVTARYWRVLGVAMDPLPSVFNHWGLATVALYSGQPTTQAPGHVIEDEGTPLTQRNTLNFVGDDVSAADASSKTTVTITGAVRKSLIDAKGDLIVGTAADTPGILTVGTDGFVLKANSAEASGLEWAAESGGSGGHEIQDEGTPLTQRAALNFEGAGVTVADDAGNDATVVTIPNPVTAHEAASDPHAGYLLESLLDAKGDLIVASADNTPARVAVGTDGQILYADSSQPAGVTWDDPPSGTSGFGYRAWVYSDFSAGEFTYVVDEDGFPIYSIQELEAV